MALSSNCLSVKRCIGSDAPITDPHGLCCRLWVVKGGAVKCATQIRSNRAVSYQIALMAAIL